MSFDPVSYIMGAKRGGGGGNPNSIVTVQGTIAAPFGTYDVPGLISARNTGAVTLMMVTEANAQLQTPEAWLTASMKKSTRLFFTSAGGLINKDLSTATDIDIEYTQTGELAETIILAGGQLLDMTAYGSMIDTTLFIIIHPLPESGS